MTPAGEKVRVLTPKHDVQGCEVLSVITRSELRGGIEGTTNLLRNAAAELGGNAVIMPSSVPQRAMGAISITTKVLRCSF